MRRRALAIMGDGGFWHNGLVSGVQSALFNGDDAVLIIIKNGYTSATGTQEIISTPGNEIEARVSDAPRANEIVVAVAVTDSGRPLPRIGGLQVSEIKGEDGLR